MVPLDGEAAASLSLVDTSGDRAARWRRNIPETLFWWTQGESVSARRQKGMKS